MDRLTEDLRAALAREAADAPALRGLADEVVRRGRRARHARRAAAAGGVAAVAALAAAFVGPLPSSQPTPVAGPVEGPPRVPIVVPEEGRLELLDWPGGGPRARVLTDAVAVAAAPAGVLLVTHDDGPALALLEPRATEVRVLVPDLAATRVAVSPGGSRATVVTAGGTLLQEVAVPTGRVLRTVPLGPPLLAVGEAAVPVGYAGDAVLLAVAEGPAARTAIWEPGDDGVVGTVDGLGHPQGGAPGTFAAAASTEQSEPGPGRDERCDVLVVSLDHGGDTWSLCRESFVGFSPDGERVLARNAVGDALLVRDARNGEQVATFDGLGHLLAQGWETPDTTLHVTDRGDTTPVVRCSVAAQRCVDVVDLPGDGRVPQPVPPV